MSSPFRRQGGGECSPVVEKRPLLAAAAGASMPDIIKARNALAEAQLDCGPWKCSNDEQALIDHANAQARAVEIDAAQLGPEKALALALHRVKAHQVNPPMGFTHSGMLARVACPYWWRRRLRRLTNRRLEQRQRLLGRTHKKAGIYISNEGYRRHTDQATKNARLLEGLVAINQDGDEYTLAELAELGLANPKNRYTELMVRISGLEHWGVKQGLTSAMWTITLHSAKHPMRHNGSPNPKYDGATPREGQACLQKQWSKTRAAWDRAGLRVYGLRIVEPHHDGTPHWHILVWMRPEDEAQVTAIMRRYALEHCPEEVAHNPSIRFKSVRIDPSKGSATGYVVKYVCKNVNGEQHTRKNVDGDDLDLYGEPLATSVPRVEAWSRCWGIRQFQFFGEPTIDVWRQLRRTDEERLADWEAATRPEPEAAAILHDARKVAIAGDYYKYLCLMGGPMQPRDAAPIRPWRVVRQTTDIANCDRITGEWTSDTLGHYGEPMANTWGLVVNSQVGQAEYLTQYYRWTIERKGEADAVDFKRVTETATPLNLVGVGVGVDFQRVGEAAAPRIFINNCTGGDSAAPLDTSEQLSIGPVIEHDRYMNRERQKRNDRIRQENVIPLKAYRAISVKQRLEHEERERFRASLDEGRELLIAMLARGDMSPADIPPGVLA
ncbi:replication endonuclease [Vreelandella sp. 21]|uniref:replication endonuclease n=1 Tax=Vreelandella sp. 21 TaxID=3402864 RepID=UPI003D9A998F